MNGWRPSRRQVVTAIGTTGTAVLAGCSASGGTTPTARATTADSADLAIAAPETTRNDEPISVRVQGVQPDETVTVRARTTDEDDGVTWSSSATFAGDQSGVVDLSEQAPESGDYDGVAPMGWLWSMTPETSDGRFVGGSTSFEVTLEASTASSSTTTDITRRFAAPNVSPREVPAESFTGVYFEPAGPAPYQPVLLLHGSAGAVLYRTAQPLASRGYAVLAPRYFGDSERNPSDLTEVPLSYFEEAVDWLRDREDVADGPVGVFGISRGGELALLLGSVYDWVGAVVSYVGSGVAFAGDDGQTTAWSLDGDPVDSLSFDFGDYEQTEEGYSRGRPAFVSAYENAAESTLEAATIPVERTDAPVLLVSGEDDQLWPSTLLSAHAADRLRERSFDHEFEHRSYPDAGHLIDTPYLPTTRRRELDGLLMGGTASGYAAAAADAWPTALEYLETGLA